jgi:phosphatidate cytidylyltransferase
VDSAKTRTLGPRLIVGFSLGGVFLLSLLHPLAFTTWVGFAVFMALRELTAVLRAAGWLVPKVTPLAGPLIVYSTYFFQTAGQWFSLLACVSALVLVRAIELLAGKKFLSMKQALREFGAIAFQLVYVPLLLSFAVLLIQKPNGVAWVFSLVITVVMIDSFGYLVGRFFGKTKLIPAISPKKTWEGFLASVAGALAGGFLAGYLLGASALFGLLFGLAILISSVLGDLSESLIKRDLNVKDMGDVLPGHGGFMDRLDSMLPSSFIAYLLSLVVF